LRRGGEALPVIHARGALPVLCRAGKDCIKRSAHAPLHAIAQSRSMAPPALISLPPLDELN
jgi:hypothetical protein